MLGKDSLFTSTAWRASKHVGKLKALKNPAASKFVCLLPNVSQTYLHLGAPFFFFFF